MADNRNTVVVSSPLCFLFSKFGKCELKKIKSIMYDFYSPQVIAEAKRQFIDDTWRIKTDGALPRLVQHRDKDLHARAWKDLQDILFMATTLDEKRLFDQLPIYTTDNTDNIPTIRLEDGELNYFLIKLHKMEEAMECLQGSVNKLHHLLSAVLKERVGDRLVDIAFRPTDTESRPASLLNHQTMNETNLMNELAGSSITHSKQDDVITAALLPGLPARHDWASSYPSYPSTSSVTTDDEIDLDNVNSVDAACAGDGAFINVEHPKKRRKRVRSEQQLQQRDKPSSSLSATVSARMADTVDNNRAVGDNTPMAGSNKTFAGAVNVDQLKHREKEKKTAGAEKSTRKPLMVGNQRSPTTSSLGNRPGHLSAAKPLFGKAVFCIDNVNVDVTEAELVVFVRSLSVRVLTCHAVNPRRSYRQKQNDIYPTDRKTFRLCINKADSKLLLNPEKWPADIAISAWYFKKDNKDTIADVHQSSGVSTEQTVAAEVLADDDDDSTHTAIEQMSSSLNDDILTITATNDALDKDSTVSYEQIDQSNIHHGGTG